MTKATATHSINSDPLIWAGSEIRRINDRLAELDHLPPAIGPEGNYRTGEKDDLTQRVYILRDFVSVVQARSLAGCLVQLDEFFALSDVTLESKMSVTDKVETSRKARRLSFSMKVFIRSQLPAGLAEKIEVRDDYLNPWRQYEDRLAEVMARAA